MSLLQFENDLRTSVKTTCAQAFLVLLPVYKAFIFCAVNLSRVDSDNILNVRNFLFFIKIKNKLKFIQSRP